MRTLEEHLSDPRFDAESKKEFHKLGVKFLKTLGPMIGKTSDVRSSPGGPAVRGEVNMTAPGLFVSIGQYTYFRTATEEDPYGTMRAHENIGLPLKLVNDPAAAALYILDALAAQNG